MPKKKATAKRQGKPQAKERLRRLTLQGIAVDDALRGAMQVTPEPDQKPKKRTAKKRAKKARKAK